MLDTTKRIIEIATKGDPTIESHDLREIIKALTGNPSPLRDAIPRVISRKEAAQILGKTVGRLDQLSRAGLLKRVYGIGNRALGYSEASVRALAQGVKPEAKPAEGVAERGE